MRPEGVFVVGAVPPFRTMFTFVIAAVLAPNEESNELSELIWVLVRPVGIEVVVGVDPSHALPVVELKPEYEVQPDGYVATVGVVHVPLQALPVVELNPMVDEQPGG